MAKDLNYYLKLPWTYRFEWSNEDNCYIASIAELPGCSSDGETIEEAALMVKDALKCYISSMLNHSDSIPEPPKPEVFKGRITMRTTPEKHYKLARKASVMGKSINKLLDETLDNLLAS
jgi:antitoxin HicB